MGVSFDLGRVAPYLLCSRPLFFLVSLNFLHSCVMAVRSGTGVQPVLAYIRASLIDPSFNNNKAVRTGEYHPSIHFLDFINTFLAVVLDDLNSKRKIRQAIVLGQGSPGTRGLHGDVEQSVALWVSDCP